MRPLFDASMFILSDLLSTLFFAGVYAATGSVYMATGIGLALGVGQIVWEKRRGRPIDTMQWLSLGLVIVFGGATLITHNALFIKLKPALIYAAVGSVMLKPGWMTRYMPPIVIQTAPEIPRVFGYVWSGLMFATAAVTVFIALRYDMKTYAAFLAVFPVGSKLALFAVQYGLTRALTVRRLRRAPALGGGSLTTV